jgi:hypothetical protein
VVDPKESGFTPCCMALVKYATGTSSGTKYGGIGFTGFGRETHPPIQIEITRPITLKLVLINKFPIKKLNGYVK